jgi:hypothetical protein
LFRRDQRIPNAPSKKLTLNILIFKDERIWAALLGSRNPKLICVKLRAENGEIIGTHILLWDGYSENLRCHIRSFPNFSKTMRISALQIISTRKKKIKIQRDENFAFFLELLLGT